MTLELETVDQMEKLTLFRRLKKERNSMVLANFLDRPGVKKFFNKSRTVLASGLLLSSLAYSQVLNVTPYLNSGSVERQVRVVADEE